MQNQSFPVYGRYKNTRCHKDTFKVITQKREQKSIHHISKFVKSICNKYEYKDPPESEALTNDALDMNEYNRNQKSRLFVETSKSTTKNQISNNKQFLKNYGLIFGTHEINKALRHFFQGKQTNIHS